MEKQLSFFASPASQRTIKKSPPSSVPHFTIYVDGAARGNPGPAGAGIYIMYKDKALIKKGIYLGEKTNNQAEYLALILALFFLEKEYKEKNIDHPHLAIISDSELLIKQLKGLYTIKNPILKKMKALLDTFLEKSSYHCKHVLRDQNKQADKLANLGIDKKHKIPTAFLKILSDYGLDK